MSSIGERALKRKSKITLTKVDLHSTMHNSFHIHLDTKSAWELLAKLSKETWIEKTGQIPSNHVDKSIVNFISQH